MGAVFRLPGLILPSGEKFILSRRQSNAAIKRLSSFCGFGIEIMLDSSSQNITLLTQ